MSLRIGKEKTKKYKGKRKSRKKQEYEIKAEEVSRAFAGRGKGVI